LRRFHPSYQAQTVSEKQIFLHKDVAHLEQLLAAGDPSWRKLIPSEDTMGDQ
jgi:hypothetical protein